jgi:hypothetical protein
MRRDLSTVSNERAHDFGRSLTGHRKTSEGSLVDTVDQDLDKLISRRASQDRRPDPDEQEELYAESVRRYNARLQEENRKAWTAFHEGQAQRHRHTLQDLIAHHEAAAARLQATERKESA